MKISFKPGKELRVRAGVIAMTLAFALVICGVAAGPVFADQHGHDNRGGSSQHHGDNNRGNHRSYGHAVSRTDNYYAPAPNYYSAPEPDYYYAPQPDYYQEQPSQRINLFFGF